MAKVSVVTKRNEGWCIIIAVFQGVKEETLESRFTFPEYNIEEIEVEKNLKDWPKDEE